MKVSIQNKESLKINSKWTANGKNMDKTKRKQFTGNKMTWMKKNAPRLATSAIALKPQCNSPCCSLLSDLFSSLLLLFFCIMSNL